MNVRYAPDGLQVLLGKSVANVLKHNRICDAVGSTNIFILSLEVAGRFRRGIAGRFKWQGSQAAVAGTAGRAAGRFVVGS